MLLTASFYDSMIHWMEAHALPCPVKSFLHIDCPGCGLQRSFIELLKGNIIKSFQYHPATIPLLLFFLFAIAHLFVRFKKGNQIIVAGYIFIALIVLTNYVYKIIYQGIV